MLTDVHSHILPGMDDGSTGVEMSLEMLRREASAGISRVIATPHFYARHEDPERFVQRRDRAEQQLRRAMEREENMPELLVGAEVRYFPGIAESEQLPRLAIRGTDSILVELPSGHWPESICRELAQIWEKRGLTPISAHIDRYIAPFRTRGIPELLGELPVLVQANAEFFLDPMTAGLAMKLLNEYPESFDMLTWVPVSRLRKFTRGYDQVELLAQAVGRELGMEPIPTLKKIRNNRPQSGIEGQAKRRANVLGAYRVICPQKVQGKRILLLDDIITTGATAGECARVLLTAGAKEVHCGFIAAARHQNTSR